MGSEPTLVPLGVVVAPHGVRGLLKVRLHNPDSDLLESRETIWLRTGAQVRRVELQRATRQRRGLLVALEGSGSREDAEALRGAELCVPRSELPPLEEGEYYLLDLVGLRVQTPGGEELGTVEDTIAYPTVTALRVRMQDGLREVPCLDPYVVEVRVEDGVLVADALEELDVVKERR